MNTIRMSAHSLALRHLLSLSFAALLSAPGATILTTDTLIGVNDATYDGQDLVVSNAVLTVDGPHAFNSLRLATGAILTHSASGNGLLSQLASVTNELLLLADTNAVALLQPAVLPASIIVTDTNGIITYTNDVDYLITNLGMVFTLERTTSSFIPDGESVLVSYDYQTSTNAGLDLAISGDLEIEPGAGVNADWRGYESEAGAGQGSTAGTVASGSGGGHGGYGGLSSSHAVGGVANGLAFSPVTLGSGGGAGLGGNGGAGGGAIQLDVGGSCILNGTVSANGQNATNSRAGGGAGGSIWIRATTLAGTGTLRANGGSGEPVHGGGGGGGRIALIVTTNLFAGNLSAVGGAGWQHGGAGTVFTEDEFAGRRLVIDNHGHSGALTLVDLRPNGTALVVQGAAHLVSPTTAQPSMTSLVVRAGSTISSGPTITAGLTWLVSGDALIESGAAVLLRGAGYPANQGPGAGGFFSSAGGGGGYGGYGGFGLAGTYIANGGNSYGSASLPTTFGSGGRTVANFPGGAGGGALQLTVTGRLQLDGQIIADGTAGSGTASGGGAGGGILLTLGELAGNGLISANGGSGGLPYGGGGGGGRIGVNYSTNSFTGKMTAFGGAGFMAGGAGTILTKLNSSSYAALLVNNGGLRGTNTPSDLSVPHHLTISGGAICRPTTTGITLASVTVGPNSVWQLGGVSGSSTVNFTVLSNLTVAVGGLISGDGLGFTSGQGPGSGSYSPLGSTGGGHGGMGGRGLGFTNLFSFAGGNAYDAIGSPTQAGSGGGGTQFSSSSGGGAGGAAVRLGISGELRLDGRISVNGNSASTNHGGGGAGGGLWLALNRFSGAGAISADGGNGYLPNGGGGGGGRIAVTWSSNSFSGTYSAKGGNGFVPGAAGTIYLKPNNAAAPSLIFDNGGLVGTNTVLDVSSLAELHIRSGASVTSMLTSVTVSNLNIGASGVLGVGSMTLNVSGSANIAAGGTLRANASSSFGSGTGQSSQQGSGGGGHGGYGGRGFGSTGLGGNVYGSIASPILGGSRGGVLNSSYTAAGGGSLRMNVAGPLIVDGVISANGAGAITNADGGGSGGSIWLTLNQFSGSGTISANGGSGHLPNGGGGGGGRIAITYFSNAFTGSLTARGGPGYGGGGAGTIYLRRTSSNLPTLIVDNGGVAGTSTLLTELTSLLDLNVRSGASVTSSLPSLTVSNLNIEANAALKVSSMMLSVGAVNIAAGGAIMADGVSSSGLGAGQTQTSGSSGGGHGGYGGRGAGVSFGGNTYDTTGSPISAGSPGGGLNLGGGRGGGSLRLNVSGLLRLDGNITANGSGVSSNNSGGGAGGTVALTLNRFSGSGLISADGGSGHLPNGGGGGGGRIAVTWLSNAFTGQYSAKGGNGFQAGGAGTVYLKPNSGQFQTPSLVVDNGGLRGTNTTFELITLSNLTVGGGAVVRPTYSGMLNLSSLNIASNGVLLAPQLSLTGPTHIAAGGSISADGLGFSSGNGISGGAGGSTRDGGGGGGHGGFGGRGFSTSTGSGAGGNAYDVLVSPTLSGSGGSGLNSSGGGGGGVIRITSSGPFTLDGRISANGLHSVSNTGGGGAGGSVILTLTRAPLLGAGTIIADGGNGHLPNGGGGGGGRIAVSYLGNQSSNGFFGTFSAKGGSGFMKGGAGTIYIRTNVNNTVPQAIVDNGGVRGTNTLVSGSSSYDLTVQGGAVATSLGSPRDVWVKSNAWLSTYLQSSVINVTRDATFDVGGGMDLDGRSSTATGGGSTFATPKGGGGHGGYGGFQFLNSGNSYDSAISPSQGGSPGGNGSGSSGLAPYGGAGGGVAQLVVGRTLRLDGDISADGRNGEFNSGGGAGGGLRLQAVTFAGDGRITANGGHGNGPAGGGSGGRIAVTYTTNLFTGTISACGGSGGQAGGAGTVFFRDNLQGVSSLLLDNCGVIGASTPFSSTIGLATNLTASRNAVAEAQGHIPVFSNLVVTSGSSVTARGADTNLHLALLGDLTVAGDSRIFMDGKGFALTNGPGAGESLGNRGAGGGYGGAGGASASGAIGGSEYGAEARPVDRGSGGGLGSGAPASGSEGGGAIRLAVAGTMVLDGVVSANGAAGQQDDSGGGSGGSVWITASQLTGGGALQAIGGEGELYGGGGGGGGRVAVYSLMNTYTGSVSVAGGVGAFSGATGTVFTADALDAFGVFAQTPVGVFSNALSQVTLEFNTALNPFSIAREDFVLYTPNGLLASLDLTLSFPTPMTVRVSFPTQNFPGDYRLEAGPAIADLFGAAMSQVHTGVVTVLPPMISGIVTDTNGQPVAGVWLQPSGGLLPTITDSNGNYALGVPRDWYGSVTPSREAFLFAPGARSYAAVSGDLTNENYLMLESFTPALSVGSDTNHLRLNWSGYAGITYQVFWTTNLSAPTWYPLEPPLAGTNGMMEFTIPISDEPEHYFRLRAGN